MFRNQWTAEQKRAYRAAFTIGRIVDELWILVGFSWFAAFLVWFDEIRLPWNIVMGVAGFLALGLASYRFLPSFVRSTMPRELSDALPEDRFAGPSSPRAPRTYRDLLRRWARQQKRESDRDAV